jgi:hypothetical protein
MAEQSDEMINIDDISNRHVDTLNLFLDLHTGLIMVKSHRLHHKKRIRASLLE